MIEPLSPEVVYAAKGPNGYNNIAFPGTAAQATAAATAAASRLGDAYPFINATALKASSIVAQNPVDPG